MNIKVTERAAAELAKIDGINFRITFNECG